MAEFRFVTSTQTSIGTLERQTYVARQPEGDEILVRIEASSLNFHDYLVVTGVIPASVGRVPLSDAVGIVEACGPAAHQFVPGERVMSTFFAGWQDGEPNSACVAQMRGDHVDGFAATAVTLGEHAFTKAPLSLSAVEAATLPCAGLTAWRAVFVEGAVRPGDTVVVQGSGGVALFALQFAKMAGARVIATTGSPEKAMKLKEMGASEVVDRSEANWGKQIHELTSGGADLLVEVAGGDLDQSLQSLKVGGRLCLVGALSRQPVRFPTAQMIYANRHIDGITVGSRQHQEQMVKAIEANGLKPVIDKVYSLTELGMAFASFEAQQHFGKIAIICSEQP